MILVTGATGKIGREVVRQLSGAGVPARALVRDRQKAVFLALPGIDLVVGDLRKPRTLDAALRGVDRVFLLSPADPLQVEMQGNAIDAAKRAGVQLIVKISVGGGPDASTQIGRWHWATEKQLGASRIPFTLLRPNLFMQGMLAFAPSIAETGAFHLPMGNGRVSVVDTRDIAAVAVCALTLPGHAQKIYDLTGPEAISFETMAQEISQAVGSRVIYKDVSPEQAREEMLDGGLLPWLADDMLVLFRSYREGYGAAVSGAISEVTRREPRSFRQFAKDYARLFREGKRESEV
ncbi:MAG: SDR family oxidoreductase [Thermoanaerobaculia bacterium]